MTAQSDGRAMTRDLGIAIRDFIEDQTFAVLVEKDCELNESPHSRDVNGVDASDPDNLIVWLDNGQCFVVRIVSA